MPVECNLDPLEQERAQMWELYALLLDFDTGFKFTAKQLSKELDYSKSELNKYLFRLYVNKALLLKGKTPNGASIYSLNQGFLTGEAFAPD